MEQIENQEKRYIHVKNLEKYHMNYKDRNMSWCKVFFTMLDGDPEFEMIPEIDKWRFIAFIILELKSKKPVPLDDVYLERKGFDLKARPISLTLQMLHTFTEVCNRNLQSIKKVCTLDKDKDKEKDKEKECVTQTCVTQKKLYSEFVYLSEKEYEKLKEMFPKDYENRIEKLNNYIGKIGVQKANKKYKSHYHVILTWSNSEKNKDCNSREGSPDWLKKEYEELFNR